MPKHRHFTSSCCGYSIHRQKMKSLVPTLFCYLFLSLSYHVESSKSSRGECIPVNGEQDSFHCLGHSMTTMTCEDEHEDCNQWARRNECRKNPSFMMTNCRKSCGTCLDLHVGEIQVAPDAERARAVLERLVATQKYIYDETEKNPQVFRKCKNGRLLVVSGMIYVTIMPHTFSSH